MSRTLIATSLLSIALMSVHMGDDIARGIEPGGLDTMIGVLILVVWLYGTLARPGRRSGYLVVFIASVLGAGVPVVHMSGVGLAGGRIGGSSGVLFWVWTLLALGVTTIFSAILAAEELWRHRRRTTRGPAVEFPR